MTRLMQRMSSHVADPEPTWRTRTSSTRLEGEFLNFLIYMLLSCELIVLCLGRASMFLGPSIVFWTNTYGPFRGFTLIMGLPRGVSLLPVKGRSDALEEIEKVLFLLISD